MFNGRGSTIPTGIFRDLPTETTDGTRHDSIPIAGAIEKKKSKKKRGRGRTGTSYGNPNVCYALSIRIPDSEMYIFQSVLLYTGNMTKEIVFE